MTSIPETQHAVLFVGPDAVRVDPARPVPAIGPTQVLVRVEAVGICFSDTKLLHAFDSHPRKSRIRTGLTADELAGIPSYHPDDEPTVPGHEVCGRVVAIGPEVRRHALGDRVLVQTDYRHLLTASSNASFGYNFEGGLQEYVLMDERVIIDPGSGERFLIPVGEEPSASAVALLEPWACVERAYATEERAGLRAGGRLLVVADRGRAIDGVDALLAASRPGSLMAITAEPTQRVTLETIAGSEGVPVTSADGLEDLGSATFDDIIYFGSDAARVEALQPHLGLGGVIDIVLDGEWLGRPVGVDVGRVHYDLTRWVGTPGPSAVDGYTMAPGSGELRDGERVGVIGAAGPMGFMHVIRAITSGREGLSVTAMDIDPARLAHLEAVAGPLAADRGVRFEVIDSTTRQPEPGFTRIGVLVPSPGLAAGAVELAGEGAILDLFAGFAVGTTAPLDLDEMIRKRVYVIGTSGSMISDMKAVLGRLEAGTLDTNISVDAISGMAGAEDALGAVQARTSGGKIVIYPMLTDLGMVRLADLAGVLPGVAAKLDADRWTRAAEEALLAEVGGAAGAGHG